MGTEDDRRARLTRLVDEHLDDVTASNRLADALDAWKVDLEPGENALVVARLKRIADEMSPAARAARQDRDRPTAALAALLALVSTQIRLVGPEFWLASLGLAALGATILVLVPNLPLSIAMWLLAPLLALLGVRTLFRGSSARVVELELACPPSPIRLAVVRLFIVLSYDTAMLLGVSGVLAVVGNTTPTIQLVGHWLGPLLLVAGAELMAGLRLRWRYSSGLAYLVWIGFVAVWAVLPESLVSPLVGVLEWGFLGAGLAATLLALRSFSVDLGGILSRRGAA